MWERGIVGVGTARKETAPGGKGRVGEVRREVRYRCTGDVRWRRGVEQGKGRRDGGAG
jgi:hypothetical protein